MKVLPSVVLLLSFNAPILTGAPPDNTKEPWQWTAEERAHARLDPKLRAARVLAYKQTLARRAAGPKKFDREPGDVIDGSVHPELFFPTALFRDLVFSSFISLPKVYPLVVAQRSSDLFLDPKEWDRFAGIAAPYAATLMRERDLLRTTIGASPQEKARLENELGHLRSEQCAEMKQSIRAARAAFGRERFDRMLYEVVASGIVSTEAAADAQRAVAAMMRKEAACQ